jgi:hypothetical protein
MKLAFLFANDGREDTSPMFCVAIVSSDWRELHNSLDWTNDPILKLMKLEPGIGLVESLHIFNNQTDAEDFLLQHYQREAKKRWAQIGEPT